jgi:hypothetical protein
VACLTRADHHWHNRPAEQGGSYEGQAGTLQFTRGAYGHGVSKAVEAEARIRRSRRRLVMRLLVWTPFVERVERLARQQRDQLHPEVLRGGRRIDELEQLPSTLASGGREDQDAMQTLRARAGWHRNDLRWAAASVRCHAWITENAHAYRANELLLAAAENRPVRPVTEQQEAWSEQRDALSYRAEPRPGMLANGAPHGEFNALGR